MLTPVRLIVRGFRGFTNEQSFDLLTPAIILSGANHCGKSSTLNALEWCLFGDECTGKGTNIRERIGWVIPNQHLERADVHAELRMDDGQGEFVVRRRLHQSGKKKSLTEEVEIETPEGEVVSGQEAKQELAKRLHSTFRDFSTTVYQHQEIIRGIVTLEPKERNDAIDRLLGLSDYRNLLSGVTDANAKGFQREIDGAVSAFEGRITTALSVVERTLEQGRLDAETAGVPRFRQTEETAIGIAAHLAADLRERAREFGLESPPVGVPARWQDLTTFEKAARAEIQRLRGAVPEQEEQSALYQRQTVLADRVTDYENLKRREDETAKETRRLNNAHGSRTGITLRLGQIAERLKALEASQKAITGRQQVIVEAVDYLDQCEPHEAGRCPVCEREVEGLLPTLRNRLQTAFEGKLEDVRKEMARLRNERPPLQVAEAQYEKLDAALTDLINVRRALTQKTGAVLGRELTPEDDPVALLKAEQGKASQRLTELKELIAARQEQLTQTDGEMDKLRSVRQALQQADKLKIIEQIKQSVEFRELSNERDRLAEFVNDVEEIRRAISATAAEEARERLDKAGATIDSFFRKLAKNPAVTRIVLQVKEDTRTSRNAYDILDQNEQDLTPVLSQGDLNAMALAIFLGLASASGPTAPMGFVMLDDPSQSMGTDHKRNLAAVLDEVSKVRQVLLATMDREFCEFLDGGLTKAKTTYVFEDWTPQGGPTIRRQ